MATCPQCQTQYADDVRTCPVDGAVLITQNFFSADPELPPGHMVGEYRIEGKIGSGGFGTVYRAEQPLIGKQVAIKVLDRSYSSNPQMVSRFVSEARAVNQIRHRNIIDSFSFGMLEDKRQYFVMELLEGMAFDAYLKSRGQLPPEEAIPILRQIAKALDAAHAAGIAHRDLKPENVFLAMDGDGVAFPKLLDFGIAKLLGDASSGHKTRTGTPIGTPHYMSPEQCLGKGVDHRADIYSFGVMTHEVLTGSVPLDAEEMMTVMFKQMNDEPPRMSMVRPELPAALDEPVLRMLAKTPEDRPSSVCEGLEALAQAARDAGLDVTVAPVWRVDSSPHTTPRFLTPTEHQLASAKTLQATSPGTFSASSVATHQQPTEPTQKSTKSMVAAAAVLLVLLVGAGGFWAMRPTASTPPVGSATERVAATFHPTDAAAVHTSTPEAAASPSVVASEEAEPATVQLTIQSTPQTVEAYAGSDKLGDSSGPIAIPRANQPLELTFKAPGYHDKTISLVPVANTILSVSLARIPTGSSRSHKTQKGSSGEIENPF